MPFGAGGEFVGGSNPPSSGGGGSGPASLSGTGETVSPGDLTQAGGLTVTVPSDDTMGFQVTDNSAVPMVVRQAGGVGMEFISGTDEAAGGGVLWQANGGVLNIAAPQVGESPGRINMTTTGSDASDITIDAGSGLSPAALFLICDGDGGIQMYDNGSNPANPTIMALRLPTSDPGTPGQLWNDAGTVKVSA